MVMATPDAHTAGWLATPMLLVTGMVQAPAIAAYGPYAY